MRYVWDEDKSRRNAARRSLPFEIAAAMFEEVTVEWIDDRFEYGEERVVAIGRVGATVLVCVYTEIGDVRRILSLRQATRREGHEYYRATQGS